MVVHATAVFVIQQTGSGTQSNMNANEVIANRWALRFVQP
jgi:fumarate hydratase class II